MMSINSQQKINMFPRVFNHVPSTTDHLECIWSNLKVDAPIPTLLFFFSFAMVF